MRTTIANSYCDLFAYLCMMKSFIVSAVLLATVAVAFGQTSKKSVESEQWLKVMLILAFGIKDKITAYSCYL